MCGKQDAHLHCRRKSVRCMSIARVQHTCKMLSLKDDVDFKGGGGGGREEEHKASARTFVPRLVTPDCHRRLLDR